MADAQTNNYALFQPTIGGDVGTWGTPLNTDFGWIDQIFAGIYSTSITSADVTLTTSQFQNGVFLVTGTLTNNHSLIIPFGVNATTGPLAVQGRFIVVN